MQKSALALALIMPFGAGAEILKQADFLKVALDPAPQGAKVQYIGGSETQLLGQISDNSYTFKESGSCIRMDALRRSRGEFSMAVNFNFKNPEAVKDLLVTVNPSSTYLLRADGIYRTPQGDFTSVSTKIQTTSAQNGLIKLNLGNDEETKFFAVKLSLLRRDGDGFEHLYNVKFDTPTKQAPQPTFRTETRTKAPSYLMTYTWEDAEQHRSEYYRAVNSGTGCPTGNGNVLIGPNCFAWYSTNPKVVMLCRASEVQGNKRYLYATTEETSAYCGNHDCGDGKSRIEGEPENLTETVVRPPGGVVAGKCISDESLECVHLYQTNRNAYNKDSKCAGLYGTYTVKIPVYGSAPSAPSGKPPVGYGPR